MATITKLVYNCTPDGLADVGQADFAEAFENEIRISPRFRDCSVDVTFNLDHRSELKIVAGADLPFDPVSDYAEYAREAAERAFAFCCEQPA